MPTERTIRDMILAGFEELDYVKQLYGGELPDYRVKETADRVASDALCEVDDAIREALKGSEVDADEVSIAVLDSLQGDGIA